MPSASASLHEDTHQLSPETINMHRAIVSLQEELEAVDWYRQRADACTDAELKAILLHNMREEIEHASMLLEWLRRNSEDFHKQLQTYLFTTKPILEVEEDQEEDEAD
ncbi:MAG: ferritin [Candidatus Competibacteraceae bacterium]